MEVQNRIDNPYFENKFSRNKGLAQIHSPNKEQPNSQRLRNSNTQNMEISKNEKEQITNRTDIYKNQFVNDINNDFSQINSRRGKLSQSGIENYSKQLSSSFKPKTTQTFDSFPSQNVTTNHESASNLINQNLYQDIKISGPKYFSRVVSLPPQYIETIKEPLYLNSNTISESKNINKDTQLQQSIGTSDTMNLAHKSYKSLQNQNEQIIRDSLNLYNENNQEGNKIKIDSVKILEPKYVNAADIPLNDFNYEQSIVNQDGVKVLPIKYLRTKVRPVKYIDSEQAKDINNIYNMIEKGEDAQSIIDLNDKTINMEGEEKTQYCGISDVLSKFMKKICG